MSNLKLTSILLLCFLALTEVTTTNIDFAGTYLGDRANLLTRVEKKVDLRYNFITSSINQWGQFPDMNIEFSLDFDQYVYLRYHLVVSTNGATHFLARMIIDGVENFDFRTLTGDFYHHTNSAFHEVWLKAGYHRIYVEYRTPGGTNMNPSTYDGHAVTLTVRYFKK